MGFDFSARVFKSARDSRTAVEARPVSAGAKAAAEPTRTVRAASFMVLLFG